MHRRACLAAAAAWAVGAGAQDVPILRLEPLPGEVLLRVAHVVNPALPTEPPGFVEAVLARAPELAWPWLGLRVRFEAAARLPIAEAFARLKRKRLADYADAVYGAADRAGARDRLVRSLNTHLTRTGRTVAALWHEVQWHFDGGPEPATLTALAERLVDRQIEAVAAWQGFFGQEVHHIFPAWVAAAVESHWPWELIVTNQLVASTEFEWVELASMLRGGVTNGITTQSPASARGLVSVLTLFPFVSDDPEMLRLRGGRRGGGPDAVEWAAALLVHELGHQLLHLGHPSNSACVMAPPKTLRFHEWTARLDPLGCPLSSESENKPGFLKFRRFDATG